MEEVGGAIAAKVQALSDIELAVLLCLVADQQCIIETEESILGGLEQELRIIASDVFGLTCAVLDCSESTTVDDFGAGILVKDEQEDYFSNRNGKGDDTHQHYSSLPRFTSTKSTRPYTPLDSRKIANVVIAKKFNEANQQVQIQALELIRGKRNYTRTAVHVAPRPFLFIALNEIGSRRLTAHLNDQIFISHKHYADDGLANLEDLQVRESLIDDDASISSVVRKSPLMLEKRKASSLTFSSDELNRLTTLSAEVQISSEVRAYLHNVVVFMRLHRAVGGGISAMATRHLTMLSHALAPLHSLSYIPPSLVALAARKIFPHRIILTAPEKERSLQWGSSLEAVKAVLDGVTVEDVIEEVLQSVEVPL